MVGRQWSTSGSLLGRPYFGSLTVHFGPLLCHAPWSTGHRHTSSTLQTAVGWDGFEPTRVARWGTGAGGRAAQAAGPVRSRRTIHLHQMLHHEQGEGAGACVPRRPSRRVPCCCAEFRADTDRTADLSTKNAARVPLLCHMKHLSALESAEQVDAHSFAPGRRRPASRCPPTEKISCMLASMSRCSTRARPVCE